MVALYRPCPACGMIHPLTKPATSRPPTPLIARQPTNEPYETHPALAIVLAAIARGAAEHRDRPQ